MNRELVLKTLDRIEGDLDHWFQDSFADRNERCGTTACFAGWAMVISGYTIGRDSNFYDTSGERVHGVELETRARMLLEFSYDQGDEIFFWFPEDRIPYYLTGEVSRAEEFEMFKNHVLAVTGISDES